MKVEYLVFVQASLCAYPEKGAFYSSIEFGVH